ncbi:MAG: translation elongation factor-like protein [Nanoarchaeota archaeon]|nr:translation elongation factor-like protein [Nanoarchaeota archaeon]
MKKEKQIGEVFSFFSKISVAAIKLTSTLKKGDNILIKGYTTNINQKVESIQIDRKNVEQAKAGSEIGIKVKDRVRPGDKVYII